MELGHLLDGYKMDSYRTVARMSSLANVWLLTIWILLSREIQRFPLIHEDMDAHSQNVIVRPALTGLGFEFTGEGLSNDNSRVSCHDFSRGIQTGHSV